MECPTRAHYLGEERVARSGGAAAARAACGRSERRSETSWRARTPNKNAERERSMASRRADHAARSNNTRQVRVSHLQAAVGIADESLTDAVHVVLPGEREGVVDDEFDLRDVQACTTNIERRSEK
jgi:hypothetical protein